MSWWLVSVALPPPPRGPDFDDDNFPDLAVGVMEDGGEGAVHVIQGASYGIGFGDNVLWDRGEVVIVYSSNLSSPTAAWSESWTEDDIGATSSSSGARPAQGRLPVVPSSSLVIPGAGGIPIG
jgi:hypothetical protein